MEPRAYRRLLLRLLALPTVALGLLALAFAYGLHRMDAGEASAERSLEASSHANRLLRLIIDEETGLRGYLLTKNRAFLEPFDEADREIEAEFDQLFFLLQDNPNQTVRLKQLQSAHLRWEQEGRADIQSPPATEDLNARMLRQKEATDYLRRLADDLTGQEKRIAIHRMLDAATTGRVSMYSLLALLAAAALLLTWETRRIFRISTQAYSRQIEEVTRQREASHAREQWLQTTLRSIGDAVIACDPEGRVVFMNPVAEQLTGWTESEAHGHELKEVFHIVNEHTRANVESPVDKVRRLGTTVGLANHTVLIGKDGTEIMIDDSGAPIRDTQARMIGVVLVFRDIGERRIAEQALIRTEKLAAAGRLAASIAHEVNNPLEGLVNLIYLARHSEEPGEIRRLLEGAEEELARVAHIARQSLGFYRESAQPVRFRPAEVVRETVEFYLPRAAALGVTLELKLNCEGESYGSPGELRQVLSNLIGNSLDACDKGDVVRVRVTQAVDLSNSHPRVRSGFRVTIADSGCGIPQGNLDRIFEPFFTTKAELGNGLGLWVSRELIEKYGGRIQVRSKVKEAPAPVRSPYGTVISIFLPSSDTTVGAEDRMRLRS